MRSEKQYLGRRYEVHPDSTCTWQIVDCLTGLPAASNGRDLVQLSKTDAKDIADELNSCEEEGRPNPLL
jgi:hypothetical protein